jgi:hypothetical protein
VTLPLLFVLLSFAVGRFTRLVVADDFPPVLWARRKIITARPGVTVPAVRITLRDPWGGERRAMEMGQASTRYWWLGELVSCAWCASGWVALGLWLGTWWFVPLPLPLLWWPAIWGAGAILAAKLS